MTVTQTIVVAVMRIVQASAAVRPAVMEAFVLNWKPVMISIPATVMGVRAIVHGLIMFVVMESLNVRRHVMTVR